MTTASLHMLQQSCDMAMSLAMGLNLGLNVRPDDGVVSASLDSDTLTSAVVVHSQTKTVRVQKMARNTHWLWLGDTSIVLTDAEAAAVQAFLATSIVETS